MSIWNKLQRGVTQAAEEAAKQTAIARKNLEVTGVRSDIRRKTNELGDLTLDLLRAGTLQDERFAAIFGEIQALEGKLAHIEAEIAEISGDGRAAIMPAAGTATSGGSGSSESEKAAEPASAPTGAV